MELQAISEFVAEMVFCVAFMLIVIAGIYTITKDKK